MNKIKKIALIIATVVLMAVCFVFGASAAEPTFEDYVNAGVVDPERQVVFRLYLNGCSLSDPFVMVYDFESGEFVNKDSSEITEYYDKAPQSEYEWHWNNYYKLPYLSVPDNLHFYGWKRVGTDEHLKEYSYYVKDEDAGKIIEFIADVQPKYAEGNFSYIVTDGKATIVKVRGFDDGKVVIPDTLGGYEVAEIMDYAFSDLYKEFSVSESNKFFSVDESGALFNKDKTKIYAYPSLNKQKSYKIPDSVEIIGTCAFNQAFYLTDLKLSENLRIIEEQGIRSCWFALDEIHLSGKIEKLEGYAVYDMPFLTKIYIEGKETKLERYSIGYLETYFKDGVDKNYCAELWAEYMEGDISAAEELAGYMEYPEESYTKATVCFCSNNSAAYEYARSDFDYEWVHFYGDWIYDYGFRYLECRSCGAQQRELLEFLTEGYYIYTVANGESTLVGVTPELEGDVVLPSTLGGYPLVALNGAFFENETVTSVVIPDGVRYIGGGTFEECRKKLKKVVMPDTVTYLGSGAFMECYNLEEVVLSNNIEVIGSYTFEMCYSLKELKLPEKLREFYGISLTGCASLKELIFPESVELIEGYSMMASSLSVEKIVIGSKAKDAGDNNPATFGELISLKDFYVYSPDYDPADSGLGYVSVGPNLEKISKEEWIALYVEAVRELDHHHNTSEKLEKVMELTEVFETRISDILTIHAVHDSKAEIYAKENGIKFEYIHDFEGAKWTYDYENMVRYRDCMYPGCDGREIEELKKTETDNGETVAPDQDGDFNIDEILGDDFLVIEEHIKENVSGDVEVEVLKGFDITLTNQDGVHIQPDGTVKVKLPLDWSKKGIYKVYHVGENGVLTDMNAYREGSHLVFDTDHFSIYVIVFVPDETTEPEPEVPDTPAEPDTESCDCICHATGFLNRILAFVYRIFIKLLGTAPVCACGAAHY